MNTINSKKCPICYSVLSTKVDFCPICGTELQTQLKEQPSPSFQETQFVSPPPRRFFEEEPIGTRQSENSFIEGGQYAWKISDERFPLRMKGQVKYSDSIDIPKIGLSFLRDLGYVNLIITGFGGLITSFFLFSLIGLSGLVFFYNFASVRTIILLVLSLILFTISSFFLNRFLCGITNKEFSGRSNSRNILPYLIIHGLHVTLIGLLIVGGMQIVQAFAKNSSFYSTFYSVAISLVLVISLISPSLRVAKLFTNIRSTGLFQNFFEASQIYKLSIKKTIELSGISFLLPSLILVGGMNSIINIFGSIFFPDSEIVFFIWDVIIFSFVLVLLTINLTYTSISDTKFVSYYESLLSTSIAPPSLKWMSNVKNSKTSSNLSENIEPDLDFNNIDLQEREFRCPSCSSILIEGAEFCTDCGKKIVR